MRKALEIKGEIMFEAGDIIRQGGLLYSVEGNYMGGLNQESVVGLKCLSEILPSAHGKSIDEMFVPANFLYILLDIGLIQLLTTKKPQRL